MRTLLWLALSGFIATMPVAHAGGYGSDNYSIKRHVYRHYDHDRDYDPPRRHHRHYRHYRPHRPSYYDYDDHWSIHYHRPNGWSIHYYD